MQLYSPLTDDHRLRLTPFPEDRDMLTEDDLHSLTSGLRRSHEGAQGIVVNLESYLRDKDPFGLNSHRDKDQVLVLYGCGNIFDRLMQTGFLVLGERHPWLRDRLTIVMVDRDCPEDRMQKKAAHLTDTCGFRHVQMMRPDEFDTAVQTGEIAPSAIYQSLPHNQHMKATGHLLSLTKQLSTTIAIEKPLFIPDEVDIFYRFEEKDRLRVIDTDFFTTDIMHWLLVDPRGQEMLHQMTPFHTINFHCIERSNEWREWMHIREISGGGTLLDCSPHNFHQIVTLLHEASKLSGVPAPKLKTDHLDRAAFASYFQEQDFSDKTETAATIRLNLKENGFKINGQAVKGCPTDYYGFEIISVNGNYLGLSLGSPSNPKPHIRFSPANDLDIPKHIIFESAPPLGYEYAYLFGRLLAFTADREAHILPTRNVGVSAALLSVECAAKAEQMVSRDRPKTQYGSGNTPEVWIPVKDPLFPQ